MSDQTPWEPDPRKMGNWRAMFEQPRGTGPAPPTPPPPLANAMEEGSIEDAPDVESGEYRPWLLQRGRSRPAMMLGLRRYDARSALWRGWGLSYPSLQAVEYLGDRMVSLDFGTRQFVIEGRGLDELVRYVQQGSVILIQEFSACIWPSNYEGPVITRIKLLDQKG